MSTSDTPILGKWKEDKNDKIKPKKYWTNDDKHMKSINTDNYKTKWNEIEKDENFKCKWNDSADKTDRSYRYNRNDRSDRSDGNYRTDGTDRADKSNKVPNINENFKSKWNENGKEIILQETIDHFKNDNIEKNPTSSLSVFIKTLVPQERKPRERNGKSVRLSNLSEDVCEYDIHQLLRENEISCPIDKIVVPRKDGLCKGFAFINLYSCEDANLIVEKLNKKALKYTLIDASLD